MYIFTHLLLKYDLCFLFCIACVRHFNRAVMWGCRTPWRVTRQRPAVQCIFISVLSVTAKACTAPSGNKNQVTWPTGITCDFMLCQLLKLFLAHLCLLLFIFSFFTLLLAHRLTPYEWYNPHPCLKGRCSLLINQYSLGNSFWFPVGGFMQQGSTIAPRALSTRCVSGVW